MGACSSCNGAKGQDELNELTIEAANNKIEGIRSNVVSSAIVGNKEAPEQAPAADFAKLPSVGTWLAPRPPSSSPWLAAAKAAAKAAEAEAAQTKEQAAIFAKLPSVGSWLAPRPSSLWLAAAKAAAKAAEAEAAQAKEQAALFAKLSSVGGGLAPRKSSSLWLAAKAAAEAVDAQDAVAQAEILGGEDVKPKALEEAHSTEQCAARFEDSAAKAQVGEAAPEADDILSDPIKKDKLASVAPTQRPWSKLPSVGTWVSGAYHPTLLRDAAALQDLTSNGAKADS